MDDHLKEAIREAVKEVLSVEHRAHELKRRAPFQRIVSDGKTWYEATATRVQAIGAILAFLGSVSTVILLSMGVRDRTVVYPEVGRQIEEAMKEHEVHAREQMEAIRPMLAAREDLVKLENEVRVNRVERLEQLTAIRAQLDRIEARLNKIN